MKKIISLCLILVIALGMNPLIDAKVINKKKSRVTTQKAKKANKQKAKKQSSNTSYNSQSLSDDYYESLSDYFYNKYYKDNPTGINSPAINYEKPENYNLIKAYEDAKKKLK